MENHGFEVPAKDFKAFCTPNHEWSVWLEPAKPVNPIYGWLDLSRMAKSAQTIQGLRYTVFADPSAEHF